MKQDHRKVENILHFNQTSKLVPQKAYTTYPRKTLVRIYQKTWEIMFMADLFIIHSGNSHEALEVER